MALTFRKPSRPPLAKRLALPSFEEVSPSKQSGCPRTYMLPTPQCYQWGMGLGTTQCLSWTLLTTNHSFLGADNPPIQRMQHRCFTTWNPCTVEQYNNILTSLLTSLHCLERLHSLYQQGLAWGGMDVWHQLDALDVESAEYMRHVKRYCRTIKNGIIPYSPEVSIWIWQCQIY